ncbi:MAG: acyl-ACP thioesterase domain-containing protein [Desulfobacterales bacterium]
MQVRSYEADLEGRLSPLSVAGYFQEAAVRHAQQLGFGTEALAREGYFWVLTHLDLQLFGLPSAGAQVAVRTWPTPVVRLYAGRQFNLCTLDGDCLARASSAWLILDARRRRPVRAAKFLERIPPVAEDPAYPIPLAGLPALAHADHQKEFAVRRRDLDFNHHVNNIAYLEWLLESIPPELYGTHRISRLQINYLAESLAGDTIACRCSAPSGPNPMIGHDLCRSADGSELARARSHWIPKS